MLIPARYFNMATLDYILKKPVKPVSSMQVSAPETDATRMVKEPGQKEIQVSAPNADATKLTVAPGLGKEQKAPEEKQRGATEVAAREPAEGDGASLVQQNGNVSTGAPEDKQEYGEVHGFMGRNSKKAPKDLNYVELYDLMNPDKPETPEEKAAREKREKRETMFAAINDGISALSNLFFTTRYAPNSYDPSKGMSAVTKDRWEKLRKEREARRKEYNDGYWRAVMMDREKERDDRNWKHTLEREEISDKYREAADDRAQAKADRDAAMANLRMQLMQGQIDEKTAAAEAKKIEAQYANAYWQSRINKNNRPASGGGRGGSSKQGEYPWYDKDGNLHYANSYEAMRQNSILNGTWNDQTQESSSQRTSTDRSGNTKGTTSTVTTKPAKGHSTAPKGKKQDNKWSATSKIQW